MNRPFAVAAIALAAGSLAAGTFSSAASARQLNGEEIRAAVEGKRIYLAVPLGGEFPMNYRPGGKVDASGEAVGLGRFARPTDSGRWWIDGNKLCQKWTTWYDGKPFCFVLSRAGEGRLAWVRDDGLKGVARVAR